jgi:hypothetical protein
MMVLSAGVKNVISVIFVGQKNAKLRQKQKHERLITSIASICEEGDKPGQWVGTISMQA